ncbi:ComF family protein [Robertmurraya massiliosenegalensis]|uniref:ComF family protein n=1 Tax=Robertmurraya massiliosenegalensis TaxID=1287657 RepID=UPI0002F12E25|nr:ComF family protein [Robertmurraya massiliosenegalensis]
MSEYCLFCHEEMIEHMSWATFFTQKEAAFLCSTCQEQLEEISGAQCEICSRPLEKLDPQYVIGNRCSDCVRWEEDEEWKGYLQSNLSIYVYNDFLKELISQYKFRGDYILAKVFSKKLQNFLQKGPFDYLVPIPLSLERQFERGFNQSEALIVEAGLAPTQLLQRTHSEKQSKKSRNDRIHLPQIFQVHDTFELKNKSILLVDDIYTTGSTLRHAAKILKKEGAQSISALTIARG